MTQKNQDWRGEKGKYYDYGYNDAIEWVKEQMNDLIDKSISFYDAWKKLEERLNAQTTPQTKPKVVFSKRRLSQHCDEKSLTEKDKTGENAQTTRKGEEEKK